MIIIKIPDNCNNDHYNDQYAGLARPNFNHNSTEEKYDNHLSKLNFK